MHMLFAVLDCRCNPFDVRIDVSDGRIYCSMVRIFVVAMAMDDAHGVCFLRCCNFCRRGTEFLFGEEALPLALPINRYHC